MALVSNSELIAGVVHVEPAVHTDARGCFVETYRQEWIPSARPMVQSNRADRTTGSLVGMYIPPGVAHGFAALTDVIITYLVDGYHDPSDELGVAWDDPEIAADWGVTDPVLSERDRANSKRNELQIRPQWRETL